MGTEAAGASPGWPGWQLCQDVQLSPHCVPGPFPALTEEWDGITETRRDGWCLVDFENLLLTGAALRKSSICQ